MRAPIIIVGAGFGGLAAALSMRAAGEDVIVLERAHAPGGKARTVEIGERPIDVGPTVLTMRWVFDELLAKVGRTLDEEVRLVPAEIVARHAFADGGRLDLFADERRSADAIGQLAGPREAAAYLRFAQHCKSIADTVRTPFLEADRPSIASLATSRAGLSSLTKIDAHRSMWRALRSFFSDPRLLMMFGRYATYVGSSPFEAPATLNLIAHVEREGVSMVEGGISNLARAIAGVAEDLGVVFHYGCQVTDVLVEGGRAAGVVIDEEGRREAVRGRAVVVNADVATLASGALGRSAALAVPRPAFERRSLSAVTWAVDATVSGFPLVRHTVFFPADYEAEHDALFRGSRIPDDPTAYVCAQDRGASVTPGAVREGESERLFVIVNAPAAADRRPPTPEEIERCERAMWQRLESAGLSVTPRAMSVATPTTFERLAPGTGGAIYGEACHGPFAPLSRPSSRTKLPGLYLTGGSVHPGPGVPMAALSGKIAARAVVADLASMRPSRVRVTAGSTWTG
jgi:1-hydroxycarotenoid 3,4-desaturase